MTSTDSIGRYSVSAHIRVAPAVLHKTLSPKELPLQWKSRPTMDVPGEIRKNAEAVEKA